LFFGYLIQITPRIVIFLNYEKNSLLWTCRKKSKGRIFHATILPSFLSLITRFVNPGLFKMSITVFLQQTPPPRTSLFLVKKQQGSPNFGKFPRYPRKCFQQFLYVLPVNIAKIDLANIYTRSDSFFYPTVPLNITTSFLKFLPTQKKTKGKVFFLSALVVFISKNVSEILTLNSTHQRRDFQNPVRQSMLRF
jgi:hypothetical protein